MKILVISHMYPSSQNQNYGIFVHKQVKALQGLGCEVKVVSPVPFAPWPLSAFKKKWKAYASIPSEDTVDGIEVFYPRYLEFPKSFFLEHSGRLMFLGMRDLVKKVCKQFQFDLIHAHVALPDGHCAYLYKQDCQVPLIVSIHGQDFQSTLLRGKGCRQRMREVLQGTDGIITVSSKLKNMVKNEPYFEKISVINNGAELDGREYKPENSTHTTLRKIISVSNLKKTKGIDLNIQALASLADQFPDIEYTVIGDGEERPNLEKMADHLNLHRHVTFMGQLPHSETMKQMASADIFCLPSWQEGFGVVYIEAMAQGMPVIGVRGEGIEDVIEPGRNGLLVRPQNVEDIVQSLEALLRDPALAARLGEAGRETVLQGYTWENNARKTADIYKEVLSSHRRTTGNSS
ncbi:MAG: putative teichuronic acid biosynthesis glycosyltransferase TuaC [Candidatus Dichloromethanomonas elyunquensis]|nr:MAG: putative teichuronic acid biosynthesis glycosyltransferase TuaC [Candidatus Dichloromethanomonas elyunquensis]